MNIVLASGSPRRAQLVRLLGLPIDIRSASVDENRVLTRDPARNAIDKAWLKADAVAPMVQLHGAVVIGCDTNVALDGRILGKPMDRQDAMRMLRDLRGRPHHVHTGLAVINSRTWEVATAVSTSIVHMRDYSDTEIEAYVDSGDTFDKAGGYGIQNADFQPAHAIEGCFAGIVGLPVCELYDLLDIVGAPLERNGRLVCEQFHRYEQGIYEQIMATV